MIQFRRILPFVATWFFAPLVLAQQGGPLPHGPGVELVYAKCQQCHPIDYVVESAGLPGSMWKYTLSLMKQLGLHVTEDEEKELLTYLTTYLGTTPPPAQPAAAVQVDGPALYAKTCAVCHGSEGQGTSDAFPPLAGHAAKLAGSDRSYLPLVVVYGLSGEIEVKGKTYHAVMPAWAHLSNEEIAAALNLVTSWGQDSQVEPYTEDEIEKARGLHLTGPEVLKYRPGIP